MAKDKGTCHAELGEGARNEISLRIRGPDDIARAVAVAEAGTVNDNDPILFCCQVDEATRFEVFDHAAIAV
jgi:hypothetical protein